MKDVNPSDSGELMAAPADRRLTAAQFQVLAKVPAAVEWFANIDNPRMACGQPPRPMLWWGIALHLTTRLHSH